MTLQNKQLVPPGWSRKEVMRKKGLSVGTVDVYISSPTGKLFRSKKELIQYLIKNKLPYKIDDFDFSIVKKLSLTAESATKNSLSPSPSISMEIDLRSCSSENDSVLSDTSGCLQFEKAAMLSPTDQPQQTATKNSSNERLSLIVSLLEGEWVMDDAISAYISLIDTVIDKKYCIHLMNPAISHAVKNFEDSEDILSHLKLETKSFILVPINDSECFSHKISGSHWSLLLYVKSLCKFYHFDSIGSHNFQSANKTAKKLSKHLSIQEENIQIEACKTPQQQNSNDCGVYMILIMETVLAKILNSVSSDSFSRMFETIKNFKELNIWSKRAELALVVYGSQRFHLHMRQILTQMLMPKPIHVVPIENYLKHAEK
uniref:Ubiquitin-like protease family profile domain-containing protein n=1 Tax=Graphocephala atropunctata TaxID=36148 RepID=A0A1B6LVU4_9HEMI